MIYSILLLNFLFIVSLFGRSEKAVICGVCRNIEKSGAVYTSIKNIEKLGRRFDDYKVIIYENNSNDRTKNVLKRWSERNPKVIFLSEDLPEEELSQLSRIAAIARARNLVLDKARSAKFKNYRYLVMADLDFTTPWPIDEILSSTKLQRKWDCISSNGIMNAENKYYWDRYAFIDANFPFGYELLGMKFWDRMDSSWFQVKNWKKVYSAFGGLAIYHRNVIIQFNYYSTVTKEVEDYYHKIISSLPHDHEDLLHYRKINQINQNTSLYPLIFSDIECCEHLTLHAAMAMSGYDNFYINPNLKMDYDLENIKIAEHCNLEMINKVEKHRHPD